MKLFVRHIVVLLLCLIAVEPALAQRELRVSPSKRAKTPTKITTTSTNTTQTSSRSTSHSTSNNTSSGGKTTIYLERAESLSFDKDVNADAHLLKGNVCLRHDDAYLYCDSAYFYEKQNSFDAYGHIRIVQGDTLFIYGDVLYYDGNTKMARLRKNVRMVNRKNLLTTDSLNYDRNRNVGYYFTGGKLTDEVNVLTSKYGYYYPGSEMAMFRYDVRLTNPNFTMDADTLRYFTKTSIADILGPTVIEYEKETTIRSSRGWYNTKTEQSQLLNRSVVKHIGGQELTGDTIFYDKAVGEGTALSHVQLTDSAKQTTLYGNYVYYKEDGDIALAHDSALMVEHSSTDTLYMNADTLHTYAADTLGKVIEAYHNVRVYRNDVQAVCDSARLETRDSVLHLMRLPVAWSGTKQITGDTMNVFPLNGAVERLQVSGNAFVCEQYDTIHYNQVSGRELVAYISDEELRQIDVRGNAVSVYFPLDDDSVMIGLNETESSFLSIYLRDEQIERIVLYPSPKGVLTPLDQVKEEMLRMPGFSWQDEIRPKSWDDVFSRPQRKVASTEQKKRRSGHTADDEANRKSRSTAATTQQSTNQSTREATRNSGRTEQTTSSSSNTRGSAVGGGKTSLKKGGR